jgi:hypothetical protein
MPSYEDLVSSQGYGNAESVNLATSDYVPAGARQALQVGGGGNLKVDTAGGQVGVTLTGVAAGLLRLRVTRVYQTGTTATGLVALW